MQSNEVKHGAESLVPHRIQLQPVPVDILVLQRLAAIFELTAVGSAPNTQAYLNAVIEMSRF